MHALQPLPAPRPAHLVASLGVQAGEAVGHARIDINIGGGSAPGVAGAGAVGGGGGGHQQGRGAQARGRRRNIQGQDLVVQADHGGLARAAGAHEGQRVVALLARGRGGRSGGGGGHRPAGSGAHASAGGGALWQHCRWGMGATAGREGPGRGGTRFRVLGAGAPAGAAHSALRQCQTPLHTMQGHLPAAAAVRRAREAETVVEVQKAMASGGCGWLRGFVGKIVDQGLAE